MTFKQSIIKAVLKNEHKDLNKHQCAMAYGRATFSKFRAEERRKVVGIKPYALFKCLSTDELVERLMKSMKAPRDVKLQYTKHIAILRKFIRDGGDTFNLYEKFREWLCKEDDIDWRSIMDEESQVQYQIADTADAISDASAQDHSSDPDLLPA